MFRSLLSALEELTLLVLPHGGQRTARRNAWRAATDLHVTAGYRWVDAALTPLPTPLRAAPPSGSAAAARTPTALATSAAVSAPAPTESGSATPAKPRPVTRAAVSTGS